MAATSTAVMKYRYDYENSRRAEIYPGEVVAIRTRGTQAQNRQYAN
jgi:hypothetical protein